MDFVAKTTMVNLDQTSKQNDAVQLKSRLIELINNLNKEHFHNQLDLINSLPLDQRIGKIDVLIKVSEDYLANKTYNDEACNKIIESILGLKSSRYIDSEIDIRLLILILELASTLKTPSVQIKSIITDTQYYLQLLPESSKKKELISAFNNYKKDKFKIK